MGELLSRPLEDQLAIADESDLVGHLNLICASKTFEGSVTLKNLLEYLFRHRNNPINEFSIAVEALNRKPDFDPQIDATVRVQVSRLRKRLRDFYLSEGAHTTIRFTVPLGSHQLVLEGTSKAIRPVSAMTVAGVAEPYRIRSAQENVARRSTSFRFAQALGVLVLMLAGICVWQYWQLRSPARLALLGPKPQLLQFWREFSANGKPVQIVIPNPAFFSWTAPDGHTLMARDTAVNSYMRLADSSDLRALQKQMGIPVLSQYYAVSSDVLASVKLMHYMDAGNVKIDITISSDASAELFENENVILVGTPGTLTPFKNETDRLYFKFEPQGRLLLNAHPVGSEPAMFREIVESPTRRIEPGLVALLPGISPGTSLLILAGQRTAALVSYLTSTAGCEQLQQARNHAGGGPFFEAVIVSETDGDTVLSSHLGAIRTYSSVPPHN